MENTTGVDSMKAITTRFFKWNQKFLNRANKILPIWGIFVLHVKTITLLSSQIVSSIDEYDAFFFDPVLFFEDQGAAQNYFAVEVAPSFSSLSAHTIDILKKDVFSYLFGSFTFDPDVFLLSIARRVPVFVTDVYLTRQMGETPDHVGKRRKLSYISSFEDIVAAVMEHICYKLSVSVLRKNALTRNKGLLRVCPLVKERKARYTTDDPSCIICFDGYNKGDLVLEGPCCHRFHRACLLKWLPRSCPMCRRSCTREFKI